MILKSNSFLYLTNVLVDNELEIKHLILHQYSLRSKTLKSKLVLIFQIGKETQRIELFTVIQTGEEPEYIYRFPDF